MERKFPKMSITKIILFPWLVNRLKHNSPNDRAPSVMFVGSGPPFMIHFESFDVVVELVIIFGIECETVRCYL